MAADCPVCGQPPSRRAQVCEVCGEPIGAIKSTDRTTREALSGTSGLVRPGRVRLLTLTGLVIVGLALSATYVALRSPEPPTRDGTAYGVARLSAEPGLRWQHPLAQVAPDLRCPTALALDMPSADACSITASSVVQGIVIVAVQRAQQAELVGLARADGVVKWRKRAPSGSTYDCMVMSGLLWCLTTPLTYQVIKKEAPSDGIPVVNISAQRSAAYRSAALTRLEPTTGAVLHSSAVPGSGVGVAFAGVGLDGFYVLGRGSQTVGTVARFSAQGGALWSRAITLIDRESNFSTLTRKVVSPQVHELFGRALVSLAEVAGRQAVFTIARGAPVPSGAGHVVTVLGATVVTQVGGSALSIGGRMIPENAVAVLSADDRSRGEPVMVTRFSAPDPASTDGLTLAAFATRAAVDPLRATHPLQIGDEPVAYCSGVIVTLAAGALAGYDAATGVRRWVAGDLDGANLQVRCSGSQVVFANEYQAVAFSLENGAQTWSITYPLGSLVTNGGYGDPGDGLVAGPTDDAGLPTGTTSMSYLR